MARKEFSFFARASSPGGQQLDVSIVVDQEGLGTWSVEKSSYADKPDGEKGDAVFPPVSEVFGALDFDDSFRSRLIEWARAILAKHWSCQPAEVTLADIRWERSSPT